jgi:hypothetical protein
MKELIRDVDRMYKLFQDENELVLAVVCGGVGMFEVKVVLNDIEKSKYEELGRPYLDNLAYDIGKNTSKYEERTIE